MIPSRNLLAVILFNLLCAGTLLAETDSASPDWAADVVWYQIFPERFRNGDPSNDPVRESLELPIEAGTNWRISSWTADWYSRDLWEQQLGKDFYENGVFARRYGGDLKGVIEKLDYLSSLGVNALYFNPVFYARSLHKYDGNSYHHIDPYFGPDPKGDLAIMEMETAAPDSWKWTSADKLFLELVQRAHERGMRVIIDGVFNHSGRDFFAFKDLRKNQQKSPYREWYQVTSWDDPATPKDEFDYKGWWGHKTLPIFAASPDGNDMAEGPKAYIFAATKRWLDPNNDGNPQDGIDGWRLDVADERPTHFWAQWNAMVRSIRPDAFTTAERWGDAPKFLKEAGFSAAMNYYAFAMPVKAFFIDQHFTSAQFTKLMDDRRTAFPDSTAKVLQNLVDSHDTDRVASMIVNANCAPYPADGGIPYSVQNTPRANPNYQIRKPTDQERKIQRLIVLMQCTYVGAPMVYYGTEAGMWGAHDPDCRMPMVWDDLKYADQTQDPLGRKRNPDSVSFDRDLFDAYREMIALRLHSPALRRGTISFVPSSERAVVFSRKKDTEELLVVLNRSESPEQVEVRKPSAKLLYSTGTEPIAITPANDLVRIHVPALTGAVFQLE